MRFAYPLCLWLVPCLLAGAFALARLARRLVERKLQGFGPPERWPRILRTVDRRARTRKYWLIVGAMCLLIVAAARPLHGPRSTSAERSGAEFYLVLDVSKSMLTRDVPPDRLEAVKGTLGAWLKVRTGDRIGLILMAGDAFVQAPLTNDYTALREVLSQSGPRSLSRGGTNLAGGIQAAVAAFEKSGVKRKAIVVISDGEGLEGNPTAVAEQAHARDQITIYTVGVGTEEGGPVPEAHKGAKPIDYTRPPAMFVKDEYGVRANSRLDERSLRTVATVGGGRYFRFDPQGEVWNVLYTQCLRPLAHSMDTLDLRDYDELFQIPLLAALLLLAMEMSLSSRLKNPARPASAVILPEPGVAPTATRMKASARPLSAVAVLLWFFLVAAQSATAAANSTETIEEANRLLKANKATEAAKMLWSAAQQNPADIHLMFNYGVAAYASKDFVNAIKAFSEVSVCKDEKLRALAFTHLGDAQYRLGQSLRDANKAEGRIISWERSVEYYETALKERNDRTTSHNLGVARADLEKALMEVGSRDLDRAKQTPELTQRIKVAGNAMDKLDKATKLSPDNKQAVAKREEARHLLADALRDQARGLRDKAAAIEVKKVGAEKPGPEKVAAERAAAEKAKLNMQASQSYQQAVETTPQDAALAAEHEQFKKAVANDFNDAAEALMAAAKEPPQAKPPGRAARQQNNETRRLAEAVANTDKALEFDADNARAKDLKAKALTELEKALVASGDAAKDRGDDLSAKDQKTAAAAKDQKTAAAARNYQQAMENYQKALEIKPDSDQTKAKLAETQAKLAAKLAEEGESEMQKADSSMASAPPPSPQPDGAAKGEDKGPSYEQLQDGIGRLEKASQVLGQAEALAPGKNRAAELQQKANEKLADLRGKLDQAMTKNEADKPKDGQPGEGDQPGGEEPGDQPADGRFANGNSPLNFSEIRSSSEREGQFGDKSKVERVRDW